MNISLYPIANSIVVNIKEKGQFLLTKAQKNIYIVATIAIACLVAAYLAKRYYFCATKYMAYLSKLFADPKAIEKLPTLSSDKVGDGDYPFIKFRDMEAPIMQGVDHHNRKFLAFRLHVTIPPAGYERADEEFVVLFKKDDQQNIHDHVVLILFQRYTNLNIWITSCKMNFQTMSPFFNGPFDCNTGCKDKEGFDNLKALIEKKHIEYDNCYYDLI